MSTLTKTEFTPVIRTDFADQAAWRAACEKIKASNDDDSFEYVSLVDDPAYDGMTAERLLALVPDDCDHPMLVVADKTALTAPDFPLLLLNLGEIFEDEEDLPREMRCAAIELWSIEANLSIANMDFYEFAESVDDDGVFRGF